jgi:hypothetical protein
MTLDEKLDQIADILLVLALAIGYLSALRCALTAGRRK